MVNVVWVRKHSEIKHVQSCWTLKHALLVARELMKSGKAESAHIEGE